MEHWTLKQIGSWLDAGAYWNDRNSTWNTGSFEDIDYLLQRNWFINNEDIYDLLDTANDEVYAKIMANRNKYSIRVRLLLSPSDFFVETRLKVRVIE